MNLYIEAFKRSFDFKGKSTRKEFFSFFIPNNILILALALYGESDPSFKIVQTCLTILLALPSLSIGVRRMHDTGKTGWLILWGIIPFIGFLIFLYFALQPSVDLSTQEP